MPRHQAHPVPNYCAAGRTAQAWFLQWQILPFDARQEEYSFTNFNPWIPHCLCGWISMITSNDSCEVGLFCLPPTWSRWIGSIQWGDLLTELSACPNIWGRVRRGDAVDFAPGWSFNEIRHIGQVVCFCNHTSIHSRWKLCRHVGIIRSISLSLYSPKHMEHLSKKNKEQIIFFWVTSKHTT
jgi:hypothetical protein